jgi:hypothetical protein
VIKKAIVKIPRKIATTPDIMPVNYNIATTIANASLIPRSMVPMFFSYHFSFAMSIMTTSYLFMVSYVDVSITTASARAGFFGDWLHTLGCFSCFSTFIMPMSHFSDLDVLKECPSLRESVIDVPRFYHSRLCWLVV